MEEKNATVESIISQN